MKIGLLGGTFDPVHNGHLLAGEEIKAAFSLDAVIYLPAGNPTHKIASRVTPGAVRLEMLKRAVEGREGFFVWDCEIKRRGYTYTADTLRELHLFLQENYPGCDAEVYYIVGTDAVGSLSKWKDTGVLFSLCKFIAVRRPGEDEGVFEKNVALARTAGATVLCAVSDKLIEASSTEIRKRAAAGEDFSDMTPAAVSEYINEKSLYRFDETISEDLIKADLRERLTEEKYIHSLGVAREARRLAGIYGGDEEKCYLAGLLHDCAKGLTRAQLDWMNIKLDDFSGGNPYCGINDRVLHGHTGEILARERFGVTDKEVLAAIRSHVTGAPEMSLTAQIVFLADYTEENREGAFFDAIRNELAEKGLLSAVKLACDMTTVLVIKRGEPLDINTIQTRNWAVVKLRNGG